MTPLERGFGYFTSRSNWNKKIFGNQRDMNPPFSSSFKKTRLISCGLCNKVRSCDEVLTNRKQAEESMTLPEMAACYTSSSFSTHPLSLYSQLEAENLKEDRSP